MTDLASLVLAVDSTQVKTGTESLDGLTAAGARAEAATLGLGKGSATAGAAAAAMAAQAQASSRAAVGMAGGANTASLAMASLGTKTHLSSLQIRESLVLMREASVGNFTRMAGSASLLAGSMATTGTSVGGLVKQLLTMVGVLKVTQNAELAETAAQAAASAASIEASARQAAGAIAAADTQLALAEAAVRVATTSEAAAAAQIELAAAHEAVAAAAAEATIAENALAVAQGRAGEAAAASAAATTVALGPIVGILAGIAIAGGLVVGAFKTMQAQVRSDHTLDDFANSLGLTKKEMKELRQEVGGLSSKEMRDLSERAKAFQLTWGDVWHGLGKTASDALDLSPTWQKFTKGYQSAFGAALGHAENFAARSYGYVVGAYDTITQTWHNFPNAIGSAFVGAVNAAIGEINKLIKAAVDGVNGFIGAVNGALHTDIGTLTAPQISQVKDSYAAAGKNAGKSFAQNVAAETAHAQAAIAKNVATIWDNILGAAEQRIKNAADTIIEDRTPKKAKKQSDHGLAETLAELDAAIAGQWRLAAAYQVSDAAAIKAEALQKAEEEAIRHKGDVGLFYEKELALAVATRAADGAKVINDLTAEAAARKKVNDEIEAGLIPAALAGQALDLEKELRPLVAAAAVAEGDAKARIIEIIKRLTTAQADNNAEIARENALRQAASNGDSTARLQREVELIGASNRVRAVGLAQLEAEQFIRDNNIKDAAQIASVTKSYIDQANATVTLDEATNNFNASLTAALDTLKLIEAQAQTVGTVLADAFGTVGDSIGKALTALAGYQSQLQEVADWKRDETKKAGTDAVQLANIEAQAQLKSKNIQLQAVGSLLAAGKSLFKEHSAGYQAMAAAEKAYALIQAVNTIKYVAAGAAKMFAQLGVWAFPAVAAMVAVMAGFAFSGGTSTQTAPTSPEDLQKAAGTGTVLGDANAKSQSIADSLDLMAKNSTKALDYSDAMVRELRSIASNIGNLAASLAQQLGLKGGFFDTTGKTGTNSSGGLFGLFASTKTTSLYDQGITLNAATIQQIMEQGITGATYQVIQTVKHNSGFLGLGASTKTSYSTSSGGLDSDITSQIDAIIGQLYTSVVAAAKVLGLDVGAALQQFQVEIGKISFKDLTGQQITDELNAIFSKIGDQMAGFAVSGLAQFQKAGEGLYETLMRLAKDYLTIDAALKSIGMTFGSVGSASIAARESLIDLAGGLDSFVSQVNFFYDHFLSEAQKIAMEQGEVNAAFQSLGIAAPQSIAQFTALVQSLDLSTDAGQQMFEALMQIAPAFYDVATAAQQLAQKQQELQVQLYQAQGNTAAATALQRQMALDALDPALRALQEQIYAAQDASAAAATAAQNLTTAKNNLVQAYKNESEALQQTIDKFAKFATDLKAFRDSLFAGTGAGGGYNSALIQLMKQAGLATAGDEGALGGGLQSAAQQFLDTATQNASTSQDVARARALVARYLDQAIGAANGQVDKAQQQLDTLKDQVSKLVDIDDSVQTVAEAIKALTVLMFPAASSPSSGGSNGGGSSGGTGGLSGRTLDAIHARLVDILTGIETGTVAQNKLARIFTAADRGGAIALVTDADSPIKVTS